MSKQSIISDKQKVDLFNDIYKRGDVIQFKDDIGNKFYAEVTYGAHMLNGTQPIIYVKGMKGCYDMKRLISKLA